MRISVKSICLVILCLLPVAKAQGTAFNITGDWNIIAKDATGNPQYGAWRITQQSSQLDVISRWAQSEALRNSSGTISETGRVLIVSGPSDGWMESFSGIVSPNGAEITGTWSRVEGTVSSKGTFVAQRARAETPQNPPPAKPSATPAVEAGAKAMVEDPGAPAENPPAGAAKPAVSPAVVSSETKTAASAAEKPAETMPTTRQPPPQPEPSPVDEPPVDRSGSSQDLATLESLLAALVEQNQLLIRQVADVRNQSPNKDQQLAAQLQREQRIFKLLERLIHSKVEMEELLELFRRGGRTPR